MAEIKSIDIKNKKKTVTLEISDEEYSLLSNNTQNPIVLPADRDSLNKTLTTGKLGNSNRIMLPKKILEREGISHIDKKVPAQIFKTGGDAFLLIKIKKSDIGIPKFSEE